ncbi:MAG: MliC family protein [Bacteroidales bacterium]|nr:MliC family protein [Bacteroidales bacterium]
MKNEKIVPVLLCCLFCIGSSCKTQKTVLLGNERDMHGCNPTAGYVWSKVLSDCIRPFEIGEKLSDQIDINSTSAAYIVFARDSARAELFLPGEKESLVLDRRKLPDGNSAWNIEDDDTKNVRKVNGEWIIEQRGKILYKQNLPITVLYQGGDGRTKMLYHLQVTFYPEDKKAVVNYFDKSYDLEQKISGSGFRYANEDGVSLTGKGKSATFIAPDGKNLQLNQR